MILATQYYRPPFPVKRFWRDDMKKMRDSGLNALQLWCIWGWIESEPDKFNFDDYDELAEEADKAGLGLILSCIAEIHPYWIHRIVPESHLVDHLGRTVPSIGRNEVNVGLTPGGCFDHPEIRNRMGRFLSELSRRYAKLPILLGWDAWNETRWTVGAQGHTCYCRHTIAAFRDWLKNKYGSLASLSEAWKRRYSSWDDVDPGRFPAILPTEMTEFTEFLTWRAAQHMRFRYEILKGANPKKPVLAHNGQPATWDAGHIEQTLCRGSDWDHAAVLDGFGCSHFPYWGDSFRGHDLCGFGTRIESLVSACRGKTAWVSELQGGAASTREFYHEPSVPGGVQQRWVWHSFSRGCKAVIFWCWRDEVFGSESSGFGIDGRDGFADNRLAAMSVTGAALAKHNKLLEAYKPDAPVVGIYFNRHNHYLDYAAKGSADRSVSGQRAFAMSLERLNIPYRYVEDRCLEDLAGIKLLIMPFAVVVGEESARKIADFVRKGGTVLLEAETDAFTGLGFYRADPAERTLPHLLGVADLGRRQNQAVTLSATVGGKKLKLKGEILYTPLSDRDAEVIASNGQDILGIRKQAGKGQVVAFGTLLSRAYPNNRYADFDKLVDWLASVAEVQPEFNITTTPSAAAADFHWRVGSSGNDRLMFLSTGKPVTVRINAPDESFGKATAADDLLTGATFKIVGKPGKRGMTLRLAEDSVMVLRWSKAT
ncbi:MAG: hypothetical protein C0404_05130 [Verrucomicrobia bacterium]|nr:hypothetical protein [Verrucomicrobiota bacterium]